MVAAVYAPLSASLPSSFLIVLLWYLPKEFPLAVPLRPAVFVLQLSFCVLEIEVEGRVRSKKNGAGRIAATHLGRTPVNEAALPRPQISAAESQHT